MRLFLFFSFIQFFIFYSTAQTPTDILTKGQLNVPYLEHLVKTKVDSVRRAHGLNALINDSILYIAAQDHANYLSTTKTISHFQNNKPKQNPQKRVEYYKAKNYLTGENILSYNMRGTYGQLATLMVKGWVKSPGHYKNIITPTYQITGVALAVHKTTGNIIVVQKFAKVLLKYSFKENINLFKYSSDTSFTIQKIPQLLPYSDLKDQKLPYHLKDWSFDKKCKKCQAIRNQKYPIYNYQEEGKIHALIEHFYQISSNEDSIFEAVTSIKYPSKPEYASLITNQIILRYQKNKQMSDIEKLLLFKNLKVLQSKKEETLVVSYNLAVLALNNWNLILGKGLISEKELSGIINRLMAAKYYSSQAKILKVYFHINTAFDYYNSGKYKAYSEALQNIYNHYSKDSTLIRNKDKTLKLANFYISLNALQYARDVLETYISVVGYDQNIYTQLLKLRYVHPSMDEGDFVKEVLEAQVLLSKQAWCELLVGDCNISFQIFDDENLRKVYCEKCRDYIKY